MEIGERYCRIQQILLTILGLWPYTDIKYKRIQRIFFTLLLSFSILLQIGKIITSASNLGDFLEDLSFAVPCLIVTLKYATFCIKSEDIKKLIDLINYYWNSIKCKEELKILQQYHYITKLLTVLAIVILYSCQFIFLIVQILPKLLDIVIPLNESRPLKILGLATFLFDQDEYFVLIFVHMAIALFVEATTILATETMGLVCLQLLCGLFKITRFFNFLNSCFEMSYFILLIMGVSSLSINMFRLYQAGVKKEIEEVFLIGILVTIHFIYIFLNNFLPQILTNHSADIYCKICELPWYSVPVPLQKLLQFIIQKSTKSCKMTLYGIFDASLEFFATIMSCSFSYFTIFVSLQ